MFNLIPYRNNESNLFRFFDEFEKNFWNQSLAGTQEFRTDIVDQGDRYVLSAELPGFQKEDIHLDLDGDLLTISARHEERNEENGDNYIRRERRIGSFSRQFDVSAVQVDDIRAAYESGVLTLELPKKNPEKLPGKRQIAIQ